MTHITPEETSVFRLLKRTAIVLLLLLRLDAPTGETEIARILEIDQETARHYLRSLAGIGLIARAFYHHGYILTGHGKQMILGQSDLIGPPAENPRPLADSASQLPAAASLSSIRSLKAEEEEEGQPAENPRVGIEERIQAFRDNGVGWNNYVQEVCLMDHVTPDLINSQAKRLLQENRFSPGLLLMVVKCNDPIPQPKRSKRDPRSYDDWNRYRYVEGEFAEFIEH